MSGLGFDMETLVSADVQAHAGAWSSTYSLEPNRVGIFYDSFVFAPTDVPLPPSELIPSNVNLYYVGIRTKDKGLVQISYSEDEDKKNQTLYPHCKFTSDFQLTRWKNWGSGGLLGDTVITFQLQRSTEKNITKTDLKIPALTEGGGNPMNAWVWYQGKWVSLKGTNPGNAFVWYGAASADCTNVDSDTNDVNLGYFCYELDSSGSGKNIRYIPSVRVRLRDDGPSFPSIVRAGSFDISQDFNKDEWLLLFCFMLPQQAVNTIDTTQRTPTFTTAQKARFQAEYMLSGSIENHGFSVERENMSNIGSISFPVPTLNDSLDNWETFEGYSSVRGEIPLMRKKKTYTYLTAYNDDGTGESLDFSHLYCPASGTTELMSKNWHPFQRLVTSSQTLPRSDASLAGTRYVVWSGDKWSTGASGIASFDKRLLGMVIQASGGIGPGTGGGGAGAYLELLINAYNKYVSISKTGTGNRIKITIQDAATGKTVSFGVGCGAPGSGTKGGAGGKNYVRLVDSEDDVEEPEFLPWKSEDKGDTDYLKWYTVDSTSADKKEAIFNWDTTLAAVLASAPGGNGGDKGVDGQVSCPGDGNYSIAGVPNSNLTWAGENYPSWSYPMHCGDEKNWPGKFPGKGSSKGGGGGCSYAGEGGNACADDGDNTYYFAGEGKNGGGCGGGYTYADDSTGGVGAIYFFK